MTATVHPFPSKKAAAAIAAPARTPHTLTPHLPLQSLGGDDMRCYVGNMVKSLMSSNSSWYNSKDLVSNGTWRMFQEKYGERLTMATLYRYFVSIDEQNTLPFYAENKEQVLDFFYRANVMFRQDIVLLDGKPFVAIAYSGYDQMHADEPDWSEAPSNFESMQDPLDVYAVPLDVPAVRDFLAAMHAQQVGSADAKRFESYYEGIKVPDSYASVVPHSSKFKVLAGHIATLVDPEIVVNYERLARRHYAHIVLGEDDIIPVRGFIGWTKRPVEQDDSENEPRIAGLFATENGVIQVPPDQLVYALGGPPTDKDLQAVAQAIFAPSFWTILNPTQVVQVQHSESPKPVYGVDLVVHTKGIAMPQYVSLVFASKKDAKAYIKKYCGKNTCDIPMQDDELGVTAIPRKEVKHVLDATLVPL